VPFSRGQLYKILTNPIYIGHISHRGTLHKGQHLAIIDRDTWDQAQALLAEHTQGGKRVHTPQASLLAGIIVDASGEPMYATHATKKKVRYRYYVSRSLQLGEGDQSVGQRLPAPEIEGAVKEQVARLFDDPLMLASHLALDVSPSLLRRLTEQCEPIANQLRSRTGGPLRQLVRDVRVLDGRLEADISIEDLRVLLGLATDGQQCNPFTIGIDFRLTRTGRAMRLVQNDGARAHQSEADAAMVSLIVLARKWWDMLACGTIDVATLARREGFDRTYIAKVVRVAFLAPDVVEAILEGKQHGQLEAGHLRLHGIPASWAEQEARFLPKSAQNRR
jgi:hypothetical protein